VPSPHARTLIDASPFDPASDLAGALRDLPDRRGLRVILWPEVPQSFQECTLILRRTFPRHAPHRVSDHIPQSPFPYWDIARNRCRNKAHARADLTIGSGEASPGRSPRIRLADAGAIFIHLLAVESIRPLALQLPPLRGKDKSQADDASSASLAISRRFVKFSGASPTISVSTFSRDTAANPH
jgi:hypothetical protein